MSVVQFISSHLALVAVRLVHQTRAGSRLATVDQASAHTALEEAGTAIAGQNAFIGGGGGGGKRIGIRNNKSTDISPATG